MWSDDFLETDFERLRVKVNQKHIGRPKTFQNLHMNYSNINEYKNRNNEEKRTIFWTADSERRKTKWNNEKVAVPKSMKICMEYTDM